MLNSVRFRLTGWYVGVLSLVMIAFSMGVYSMLAKTIREEFDRQLAAAFDVLSRSLRHEIEEHKGTQEGEPAFAEVVSTVYRDSFPGVGIAVYQGTRRVALKPGLAGQALPPTPIEAASSPIFRDMRVQGEPWRELVQDLPVNGAGTYQFVSVVSLVPVEAELAGLRETFFFAIPLALIAAAIGGFLLARKSLAPVVEMSDTASRISSKDLSQRVAVSNPKDELGKLASTFNRLLERLEGSFALQRQFMEDSSHELRTPIYVAHTAAQVTLGQEGRTEAEYREAISTIDQQLRRLQHIVEDMFVLARADAGGYPLQIGEFDLGETVDECVRAAALLGQQHGVSVKGPELTELPGRGDEGLIRQLVLILLDNAVKYTPAGGSISVVIDETDPQSYSIIVRDTGPGIPQNAREKIFERFYRVDKARSRSGETKGSGAGLGLAIAKWITSMHGGSLSLVDTDREGSSFRATILRQSLPNEGTG